MEATVAAQITCSVYQAVSCKVRAALQALGVTEYHVQSSRAVVLCRRQGFLGVGAGIGLEEEPADRFIFHVPASQGDAALRSLAAACDLAVPGRGTAVLEEVQICAGSAWAEGQVDAAVPDGRVRVQSNLAGITCTVQRGRGNTIVKAILGLGVPMPVVTAGIGTGLRDKLGLVRIALPAEKDVVHAVVADHEVVDIVNLLDDAGRLDRPGSGFLFAAPIVAGTTNQMVIRGQRHSASIEQLIAAVDDLKGSVDWRRRALGTYRAGRERHHLRDLVDVILMCNEGCANRLVQAAAAAGAPGATIYKLHHAYLTEPRGPALPAREMTELVVGQDVVEPVVRALLQAGVHDPQTAGMILLKPVPRACTYRGGKR